MDPVTLIDATASPVTELGAAFAFAPSTALVAERLGLDVFMLYCLGRGGVLGDEATTDDVVAAFGGTTPQIVRAQWDEARAVALPSEVARAYLEAARSYARKNFAASPSLDGFCAAAKLVVDAAPFGRWPIVDGYRGFELPKDTVARAYQLVVVLKELRAAAHAEAVVALGVTDAEAHYLASEDYFELYGYDASGPPEVTDELVERRALAEDAATALLAPIYGVLDDEGAASFLEGVRELAATADVDVEDVSV